MIREGIEQRELLTSSHSHQDIDCLVGVDKWGSSILLTLIPSTKDEFFIISLTPQTSTEYKIYNNQVQQYIIQSRDKARHCRCKDLGKRTETIHNYV